MAATWKKKWISPIALDTGHDAIKLLQLQAGPQGLAVRAAAKQRLPELLRRQDHPEGFQRYHFTLQAVRKMLRDGRFQGRRVATVLSGEGLDLARVRVPAGPDPQLRAAVLRCAREELGYADGEGSISYVAAGQVRQGHDLCQQFLVFGAADQTLQHRLGLVDDLRLTCTRIEPAPCALHQCFIGSGDDRSPGAPAPARVVVDLGQHTTTVLTAQGGQLTWARQAPLGGCHFTRRVAEKLHLGWEDAEQLRRRPHHPAAPNHSDFPWSPGNDQVDRVLVDLLREPAAELAQEILLCLRYHGETFAGKGPRQIVLTGGEAASPLVRRLLEKALQQNVCAGTCFAGVAQGALTALGPADGPLGEWALALGVCLAEYRCEVASC